MSMERMKIIEFQRTYREVFNISDEIILCGREKCKELIALCNELDTTSDTDYGNALTGIMNVENIHKLYDKIRLSL